MTGKENWKSCGCLKNLANVSPFSSICSCCGVRDILKNFLGDRKARFTTPKFASHIYLLENIHSNKRRFDASRRKSWLSFCSFAFQFSVDVFWSAMHQSLPRHIMDLAPCVEFFAISFTSLTEIFTCLWAGLKSIYHYFTFVWPHYCNFSSYHCALFFCQAFVSYRKVSSCWKQCGSHYKSEHDRLGMMVQ